MEPTAEQGRLFPEQTGDDTVFINDRCRVQTLEGRRVVSVCGFPIAHYAVGERMAEAHAMVQDAPQGSRGIVGSSNRSSKLGSLAGTGARLQCLLSVIGLASGVAPKAVAARAPKTTVGAHARRPAKIDSKKDAAIGRSTGSPIDF